jgi:molybdopterin-binding protein
VRRWIDDGDLEAHRSAGNQRLVPLAGVRRLLAERRPEPPTVRATSARNQLPAVVTEVVTGVAAATVEMRAGPFRLLALTTAESIHDLGLAPGTDVVATIKATNVVVGLPED